MDLVRFVAWLTKPASRWLQREDQLSQRLLPENPPVHLWQLVAVADKAYQRSVAYCILSCTVLRVSFNISFTLKHFFLMKQISYKVTGLLDIEGFLCNLRLLFLHK